jgi:splicing factor 3B subunit 4
MSTLLPPSLTTMFERNQEATCYIGNVDVRVNEDILWELFTQCGPVINVHMPRDKISGDHQGFGFVEFRSEDDADYAIKIMHMIKLFGKPIKVNKASQDKRTQEVGANIFVGNLGDDVDEKALKDIFSRFGVVLSTKVMRDPESGSSKRYGFVSFDNFESSDEAINKMNGQYIAGKPIEVMYALKKDSKIGDKHGSVAERILAANRPNPMSLLGDTGNRSMTGFNQFTNPNIPMMPFVPQIPQMPQIPQQALIQMPSFPMGMPLVSNEMIRPPLNPPKQK